MKKFLLLLVCLLGKGNTFAENITAEDIIIPYGSQATIELRYVFDVAEQYCGYQFALDLPDGIETVKDVDGCSVFTLGGCHDSSYSVSSSFEGGLDSYVALSLKSSPLKGTEGILLSIPIKADEALPVGTEATATLKDIQFGNKDGVNTTYLSNITFKITIGPAENIRTILDENSTTAPEDANGVNVLVKRTIKANEWSTICLPFSMTEEDVENAFGEDVKLAEFEGVETTEDDEENVVGLLLNFTSTNTILANHPYLIKVAEEVSEFSVDNVDIMVEEDISVDKDEYTVGTGKKKVTYYNKFVGSYVAHTEIPNLCLFLSGNKFWYSTGATRMKAFRGYFDFYDVLTDVENEYSESKIRFSISDLSTSISGVSKQEAINVVYSADGKFLGQNVDLRSLPKGVYIVNGIKVVNK